MGLEPMASSLPRKCSTTELQQPITGSSPESSAFSPQRGMTHRCEPTLAEKLLFQTEKRVKGIEPSPPAWKAGALPLSYTRNLAIPNCHPKINDSLSLIVTLCLKNLK